LEWFEERDIDLKNHHHQHMTENRTKMETEQQQHLPTYDPLSHVAKKELSRIRSAHKAVHLIPLLVLLCAIILWFFSSPTK
jgi:hypothetical protein